MELGLPVQPTPFVGRQRELEEILQLLKDPGKRLGVREEFVYDLSGMSLPPEGDYDSETALKPAREALELGEQSGSSTRKLRAVMNLAVTLAKTGGFQEALRQMDLIEAELKETENEKLRLQAGETRKRIMKMRGGSSDRGR